jgi:Zn-dependent metalloprotease
MRKSLCPGVVAMLAASAGCGVGSVSRDPDLPMVESRIYLTSSDPDDPSLTHTVLQPWYQGVRIYGSGWVVHEREGRQVARGGGTLVPPIAVGTTPRLNAADAGVSAAQQLKALMEMELPLDTSRSELLIVPAAHAVDGRDHLGWTMESPRAFFLADAFTGDLLLAETRIFTVRDRKTYSDPALLPSLNLPCSFSGISSPGNLVASEDTSLDAVSDLEIRALHEGMGGIYDYWWQVHRRDSFQDTVSGGTAGAPVLSIGNASLLLPNAFWDGTYFVFSKGLAQDPTIPGHEFAHAVVDYEFAPVYADQSGALSEGLANFFAVRAAQHAGRQDLDDMVVGGHGGVAALYDLVDPTRTGQPDHMDGYRDWPAGICDLGTDSEVHYNHGIIGKALTLLARGSGGHSLHEVIVGGIGTEKTEAVVYGAIQRNRFLAPTGALSLSSNATFVEFAEAMYYVCCIFADLNKHSVSRVDCKNVDYAFRAVGLRPGCLDYDGDEYGEGNNCLGFDADDFNFDVKGPGGVDGGADGAAAAYDSADTATSGDRGVPADSVRAAWTLLDNIPASYPLFTFGVAVSPGESIERPLTETPSADGATRWCTSYNCCNAGYDELRIWRQSVAANTVVIRISGGKTPPMYHEGSLVVGSNWYIDSVLPANTGEIPNSCPSQDYCSCAYAGGTLTWKVGSNYSGCVCSDCARVDWAVTIRRK